MRQSPPALACVLLALLGVRTAGADNAAAPSAPPATQPAPADAAQPLDLKAEADERHKHIDPRWINIMQSQRNSARTQWKNAPIVQTYQPGTLAHLSLANGMLKVETLDLITPAIRVAVEGTDSIWVLSHVRIPAVAFRPTGDFITLSRYDLDARDDEAWHSRIFMRDHSITIIAQSIFGTTTLQQNAGILSLRVLEYGQWGQPQKTLCTVQASSLVQLRCEHPEDFRVYVSPLLARFSDLSIFHLGAGDVYPVFTGIPADQRVVRELQQVIPQLDADDPADREAASAKLLHLGRPGVIAALRIDESNLSEEQKLRLKAFVSSHRRRPVTDPAVLRHDRGFLIDCLEFNDPAVRAAARAELEKQTGEAIAFDTQLTGAAAARSADALRKRLLAPPPPPKPVPATNPAPQV